MWELFDAVVLLPRIEHNYEDDKADEKYWTCY